MDELEKINSNLPALIEWEAPEYEAKERTADWFWALGAIAFFAIVISFILGNLLLALIIAIAAFAIYMYENREPEALRVRLSQKGIQIGDNLYPYEKAKYFWVDEDREGSPQLIVHYERSLFPHIHILIENTDPANVRAYLKEFIDEEEHKKTLAEEIADALGF